MPTPPQTLEQWEHFWANFEHIFTVGAIIAGGVWAWFHYFRGRVYWPRLEPRVTGEIVCVGKRAYLRAVVRLHNVGLSRVEILQRGSGLTVQGYEELDQPDGIEPARLEAEVAVVEVFTDHQWIEPNEIVEEQHLLVLPATRSSAFRLKLFINSQETRKFLSRIWKRRELTWTADAIVPRSPDLERLQKQSAKAESKRARAASRGSTKS